MQVQSLTTQLSPGAADGGPASSPLLRGSLGFISEQLGMSREDLESALRKGVSVNDLARRQGVSVDDLRQKVAAHIAQVRAEHHQMPIAPERLEQMVGRALAQGRPAGAAGRGDPRAAYGVASAAAPDEPESRGISILA